MQSPPSVGEDVTKNLLEEMYLELRRLFRSYPSERCTLFLNEYWLPKNSAHAGEALLHLCVSRDTDILKYLLSLRANPNIYNLNDDTPLHLSCKQKRKAVVRILIQYNADPSLKNCQNNLCWQLMDDEQSQNEMQQLIESFQQKFANWRDYAVLITKGNIFREFVASLNGETTIEELINGIFQNTDLKKALEWSEESEEDQEQIKENINQLIQSFADIEILKLEHLTMRNFEEWPIIIDLPPQFEYILEKLIDIHKQGMIEEIENISSESTVAQLLRIANNQSQNKYTTEELTEFKAPFEALKVDSLQQLSDMPSENWDKIDIDTDIITIVRDLLGWYSQSNPDKPDTDTDKPETDKPETKTENPAEAETGADTGADTEAETEAETGVETGVETEMGAVAVAVAMAEEKRVLLTTQHSISAVTVDDKYIHAASTKGELYVWHCELNDVFHTFEFRYADDNTICAPVFMQFVDAKYQQLIVADDKGCVSAWFLHSNRPRLRCHNIARWQTHKNRISGLCVANDIVCTIGFDGFVNVRDLAYDGKIVASVQLTTKALTAMIAVSNNVVLIGTEDGTIFEFNLKTYKVTRSLKLLFASPIRNFCLDSENELCYFSFNSYSIGVLQIGSWQYLGKFLESFGRHQSTINHLCFRNGVLWSGSDDNTIRVWDLRFLISKISTNNKKAATEKPLKCMTVTDKTDITDTALIPDLEVWEILSIKVDSQSGVQRFYFTQLESEDTDNAGNGDDDAQNATNEGLLIPLTYGNRVIGFEMNPLCQQIPIKLQSIMERREELLGKEQALETSVADGGTDKKDDKKGKKKKK